MTLNAAQIAVVRQITAACDQLGHPEAKVACVCAALVEASLINVNYGDISYGTGKPSTSLGIYQQTAGYGPAADRMNIVTATQMFLFGGPQGQRGYVNTDPARSVPLRIQDVQGSQFDGKPHTNPATGRVEVLPYAQNYIDSYQAAVEIVAEEGTTVRLITDVADVLRSAGLTVIERPGWKDRYETDGGFDPIGLLLHHDAMGLGWNSNPNDDMNVPAFMEQNGNSGSQLWVRKDGAWAVMSSGRKWHAGRGIGYGDIGRDRGNTLTIGIETDHTIGNPWPDVQVDSIYRGSAAMVQHYGFKAGNCFGHKEYAPDRKIDPENFDLDLWRSKLSARPPRKTAPGVPFTPPGTIDLNFPAPTKDWFDSMSQAEKNAFKQEVIDAVFKNVYGINKQFVDPAHGKPQGDMQRAFNVAANAAGHDLHVTASTKP